MRRKQPAPQDVSRLLTLLWRASERGQARRGRRPALDVNQVVSAGIRVADRDGLSALSIRRVAEELGTAAMNVYTHVSGRADLVVLMLDAVYLEMPRPRSRRRSWRTRVAEVAESNRQLYAAHPWAASAPANRPPLGPGVMAKYQHELAAFVGTGLGDVQIDAALTFVLDFVRAAARSRVEVEAEQRASGLSDQEWWERAAPVLEQHVDPMTYPAAVRVGTAAGSSQGAAYHPDRAYRFGLERVLDGLAVLIDQASSTPVSR